jgi:hypothetical protein
MDESRVTARPFSGKMKGYFSDWLFSCAEISGHPRRAPVSLAGTISFGLKSLPPFLVTTSDIAFKSRELIRLRDEFYVSRTTKGYMMIEVMNFGINSILGPYVKSPPIIF